MISPYLYRHPDVHNITTLPSSHCLIHHTCTSNRLKSSKHHSNITANSHSIAYPIFQRNNISTHGSPNENKTDDGANRTGYLDVVRCISSALATAKLNAEAAKEAEDELGEGLDRQFLDVDVMHEKPELAIDVEEFRSTLDSIGQTLSQLTFHLHLFRKFTVDPSCLRAEDK